MNMRLSCSLYTFTSVKEERERGERERGGGGGGGGAKAYEHAFKLFSLVGCMYSYKYMHGQMHHSHYQITVLLAHDPLSSSSYPKMTHPHSLVNN